SAKLAMETSVPIENPARTTKTPSMRTRRTTSRSIWDDSSGCGELDPEDPLDDRRAMHAVDERPVDDREVPSTEGEVQPRELGRLRRAEDRRVPPHAGGAVRTDDVADARREEAPRDDEERGSFLGERTRVRQVVHVEPVREVHDVDRDARWIPEEEQHANAHVLVWRRDGWNRDVLVADIAADLHTRVARGDVPI